MDIMSQMVFIGFSFLILSTLYIVLFTHNKQKSKETQEPGNLAAISNLLEEINLELGLLSSRDDSAILKKELEILKQALGQLEKSSSEQLKTTKGRKLQLERLISDTGRNIDSVIVKLAEDNSKLLKEKEKMELKLNELQAKGNSEIQSIGTEIEGLKGKLASYINVYKDINHDSLKGEFANLQNTIDSLEKQSQIQYRAFGSQLVLKDENIKEIQGKIQRMEAERLEKLGTLNNKKIHLERDFNEIKQVFINQSENYSVNKQKSLNEIERLKQDITGVEKENNDVSAMLTQNELLKEEVNKIELKIKADRESFNKAVDFKNREISEFESEAQKKEKSIKEEWEAQEIAALNKQKELEEEVSRVKSQMEKLDVSGRETQAQFQDEINRLQGIYEQKQDELLGFRKNNEVDNGSVNNKLKLKIDSLREKIKEDEFAFKSMLNSKDEQLYTLKARLSVREDRLKADIAKRKQMEEKLLVELRAVADNLRNKMKGKSDHARNNIEGISDRVNKMREEVASIESDIESERKVAGMIEEERKKIEIEVSSLEEKFLKEMSDINNILDSKKKQLEIVTREIVEKEKLFKIESSARAKLAGAEFSIDNIKKGIQEKVRT